MNFEKSVETKESGAVRFSYFYRQWAVLWFKTVINSLLLSFVFKFGKLQWQ